MYSIKKTTENQYNTMSSSASELTKTDGRHHGIPACLQRLAAITGLLLLSPFLLVLIALIKLESQGPCVYKQVRVGKLGRRFTMYKFRSMYMPEDPRFRNPDPAQSDREGVCAKYRNDPRITRIGAFIRKYSIDELPQLMNVVRGDMLLIGPRPALEKEVHAYQPHELGRLNSEQGLTGLWQVTGRADTTFAQQVQLDKRYISEQSALNDVTILLKTIPCVIGAKGAY
ncbi:sugar transferase [Pseudoalteromonas rubra]|uniref:Multidrug MFS transporter n=1 Tax=Pseudoalteromonas rubra TaxID=43658 RepID=A0A0U3IHW9_9GAMM|nr:sugar transferase [Pseudoalteromonas rubra]ALU42956.1 multidrug MFS transporter [Pseudoalteromonas rubra]